MPTHRWGDYTPSGHLGRILDDKTPQLGGMLDGNGFTFNGAVAFEAQAGEALSKGNVVYVSGVSGNKPVVMKADADDAAKMPAFGIAETDANLNANVNVVTFGTVYEIDTSAYSAGDELYVSTTAGALTATKPTGATAKLQNIGKVIRSHASAGSIKVGGAGRTNAVPNLDNGTVFIGDSNNQAEQRALVEADISDFGTYIGLTDLSVTTNTAGTAALSYNNTTGVFSYTPPDLSSFLTAESDTLDSVTDRGATTTNAITVGNLTSTGIDDNATSTAITIGSSGTVSIQNGSGSGSNGNLTLTASSSGNEGGQINFNTVSSGTYSIDTHTDNMRFLNGTTSGDYYWYKNSNSGIGMTLTGAGNVGIGTTSPGGILHLRSDDNGMIFQSSSGVNARTQIFFQNTGGTTTGKIAVDPDGGNANVMAFSTGSSERMRIDSSGNVELKTQYADLLFNGESGQGRITTGSGAAGGFTVDNVYSGAGINFKNSGAVEIYSSADSAAVGSLTIDTGGGINIGGSAIGSRVNSISIVGDTDSSPIAMKNSQHATVFSVLPWSSGTSYLSSGTYYDDGAWVHASDNAYSALFHLAGTGANWYASSNSSASWNLASNQVLWNSAGQWSNDVSLASTKDIILPLNNNDIMFQAANVDITANSGRSGVVRFANTAADTWTGFSSYTGGRDWQYLHRDADCGVYDNTAGQWKIRHNTGAGTYFYYGSTLVTQTTSEGTYTDGIGTFATASGPAIKISDTSGTGALNHNSWLSFRDSAGTELGYVGYGSSGDTDLSLSNYNNGVVNIKGTKASVITSTGYIEIGSLNTSHAHFYTDRGSYYFNKLTYIDGTGLRGYDNSTDCRFPIYYDLQDTSYYCDPASTSRFNINYSNNHSTLAGNGNGLRFWNSDSYKIFMSTTGYGGQANGQDTSDYNMYFTMASGTNRGFVFRNITTGLKAAIDGNARGYFERVHIHDGQNASGGLTTGSTYLDVKYNATGAGGMRLLNSANTLQGYWYANGSGEHGFLDNDGAWAVRCRTGTNALELRTNNNNEFLVYTSYVRGVGSVRSPIFYDFNNTTYYAHLDNTADSIRAAGDIVAYYSDERLKDIEGNIPNALDKVLTLNGFYYRGNEKAQKLGYDDKLKVGLSAQEVQKVLPEVIKSCPADNRYMTLDYSKVVPLLVEAIKELKSEIEELKK